MKYVRGATGVFGSRGQCPRISIHAPPRGATLEHARAVVVLIISIHAPPRGATAWGWSTAHSATFQFTPLREGRRLSLGILHTPTTYFNSRPSARGDSPHRLRRESGGLFQFTPLREGRRQETPGCGCPHISIHAPPRGATRYEGGQRTPSVAFQFTPLREGRLSRSVLLALPRSISIHAPPRGATLRVFLCLSAPVFQFTPLREGRPNCAAVLPKHRISIHAPPRGATDEPRRHPEMPYFNSRPSARGDSGVPMIPMYIGDFNSRPSARGDEKIAKKCEKGLISIHAPPRGATW